MAQTTVALLTQYLPRYGWPAFAVVEDTPDGGKILTGWRSPFVDEQRVMFLALDHRANVLLVVVPALVSAPQERMPISHLADVLTAVGFANYALSTGRFAYDPRDGEIRYEYDLPVDNAEISFEQFQHILNAAQAAVMYWAPRFQEVAQGARTGGAVVDSFFQHVAAFAT
jgi:Putative bacterial sensory transduction regulator